MAALINSSAMLPLHGVLLHVVPVDEVALEVLDIQCMAGGTGSGSPHDDALMEAITVGIAGRSPQATLHFSPQYVTFMSFVLCFMCYVSNLIWTNDFLRHSAVVCIRGRWTLEFLSKARQVFPEQPCCIATDSSSESNCNAALPELPAWVWKQIWSTKRPFCSFWSHL